MFENLTHTSMPLGLDDDLNLSLHWHRVERLNVCACNIWAWRVD